MYVQYSGNKRKGSFKGNQGSFKRFKGGQVSAGSSSRSKLGGYSNKYFAKFRGPSQVFIRQPNFVPDRLFCKFQTALVARFTSASGPVTTQMGVKANSLYDPTGASGTSPALGSIGWSQFYNNYTVLGCKVDVTALQETSGTASNTSATLVIAPHTASTLAVDNTTIMCERYAKFGSTSTSLNRAHVKNYLSTAQYWGIDKTAVLSSESSYRGVLGSSDPTSLWYFIISYQGSHPTEATTATLVVRITQYAMLWRPLSQS